MRGIGLFLCGMLLTVWTANLAQAGRRYQEQDMTRSTAGSGGASATRMACLENHVKDGQAVALQFRHCATSSHQCAPWQKRSIASKKTAVMAVKGPYDQLKDYYFEVSVQSGQGLVKRDKVSGGRVNANPRTFNDALRHCGGRIQYICGDGRSQLYLTNENAGSVDRSCLR